MADARLNIHVGMTGASAVAAGMRSVVTQLGALTAGFLAVNSLKQFGLEALKLGGELNDLSARTRIGVRDLVLLQQAYKNAGIETGAVARHVGLLQKKIYEAANGNKAAASTFRDLGVSALGLQKLAPAEQFQAVAQAIGSIKNPTEQAAMAMEVFGKNGTELLVLFNERGGLTSAANQLGVLPALLARNAPLFDEIADSIERIQKIPRNFFVGVFDQLAPLLKRVTDAIESIDFAKLGQKFGAFVNVALDFWKAGKFDEFISLTFQAGIEVAQGAFANFFTSIQTGLGNLFSAGNIGNLLLRLLLYTSRGIVTTLSDLLGYASLVVTPLTSGIIFAWEKVREFFVDVGNAVIGAVEGMINGVINGLNAAINAIEAKVTALRAKLGLPPRPAGKDYEPVKMSRIEGQPARRFETIEAEENAAVMNRMNARRQGIRDFYQPAFEATGSSGDLFSFQNTGSAGRLGSLINNRITPTGPAPAAGPAGGPVPVEGLFDKAKKALEELYKKFTDISQQIADNLTSVIGAAVDGISGSIQGLITGTMSWGDALRNIYSTLMQSVIRAISDMAAQWIVSHIIMKGVAIGFDALLSMLGWKRVAESNAQEAAKAPMLMANAAAASVGSYGIAALVGVAALLAVMAAFGGFAEGGYTGAGAKYDVAGLVHRGEFVMPASATNRIGVQNLEAMRQGGELPSARPMQVVVTDNRRVTEQMAQDPNFESIVMDMVTRNRARIGVST